jgi:GTP-binding protein LepA
LTQTSASQRGLTRTTTRTNANGPESGKLLYEDITYKIRGAAFKVKKELGLGHKEGVYHKALEKEFSNQGLSFESEKRLSVRYEGEKVGTYQPDFVVEDKITIELKALPKIAKPQQEQLWSYLKGGDYKLAMLVNFGSTDVEFKRIVYDKIRRNGPRRSALSPCESVQIQNYVLNLIDTPGHVDFAYEVPRSLAAVEGAVLLVDATQGVQAQTLTNLYFALEQDLEIIPVLNKIDLPNADVKKVKKEIVHILGCSEEEILAVSGKTGKGVEGLLQAIVERVPAPKGKIKNYETGKPESLRALIFDSVYDSYKGVMAYVRIIDGEIKKTDHLHMLMTKGESSVVELGHLSPKYTSCNKLSAGDIGYIATGFKSVKECKVGDTITLKQFGKDVTYEAIEPLPGYKEVQPMVYASFYPVDGGEYNTMRDALDKLTLNDGAFTFEPENNQALGRGFRCGFLGLLHLEIIQARLDREFDMQPTITTPSVVYRVHKSGTDEIIDIYSPTELPDPSQINMIEEPYVKLEIITPSQYLGSVMELMGTTRAEYKSTDYIDEGRVQLVFDAPLMEVIVDFHDQLKSVSSGYASMSYEPVDYRASDLVRVDILVAGDKVDAFSRIIPRDKAFSEGRVVVDKLKEILPRQNFVVAIQAVIGAKVIARASLSAFRKDVIAKLYGGDITRKRKLLEKQKKGKKKMAQSGKVEIPPEAFLKVLRK